MTVTDTSRPLFQLKPTCGLSPVDCWSSVSTARACLKPSVTVLTESQAAKPRAITSIARTLDIDVLHFSVTSVDRGRRRVGQQRTDQVRRRLRPQRAAYGPTSGFP